MATDHDALTPEAQRDALRDLVRSTGWALFLAEAGREWGAEEVLAKQAVALAQIQRGDQEAINDTVQQIQGQRHAIQALLRWPTMRLAQLEPDQRPKTPFAALRRIAR